MFTSWLDCLVYIMPKLFCFMQFLDETWVANLSTVFWAINKEIKRNQHQQGYTNEPFFLSSTHFDWITCWILRQGRWTVHVKWITAIPLLTIVFIVCMHYYNRMLRKPLCLAFVAILLPSLLSVSKVLLQGHCPLSLILVLTSMERPFMKIMLLLKLLMQVSSCLTPYLLQFHPVTLFFTINLLLLCSAANLLLFYHYYTA